MEPYIFFLGIPLAAFLFLIFDLYPGAKSFRSIVSTLSFWLLWIIFSVLNVIAFATLKLSAGAKIEEWVGPQVSSLVLVLLATLGTVGVIQSLALKIGDFKFIDLGSAIDNFKHIVLADAVKKSANRDLSLAQLVADKLVAKYATDPQRLRNEYASMMTFGGRTVAQIGQELATLQVEVTNAGLNLEPQLAVRIAQTDIERAKQLLL